MIGDNEQHNLIIINLNAAILQDARNFPARLSSELVKIVGLTTRRASPICLSPESLSLRCDYLCAVLIFIEIAIDNF
jgi:hypothetical protein